MKSTLKKILLLGKPEARSLFIVIVLIAISTATSLFEPWIYRAIVDDIAGVLQKGAHTHAQVVEEETGELSERLYDSVGRLFQAPLKHVRPESHARVLQDRSAHEAVATIVVGAALLVFFNWISQFCALKGDNRVTASANRIESGYIKRLFGHMLHVPLSFFTQRASGTLARQIDQSDQIAPVFSSICYDFWPDLFRFGAIFAIITALNTELALIAFIAVPVYALVSWRMSRQLETRLGEYYDLWDGVSAKIQETLSGIKTVYACGTEETEHKALSHTMDKAYETYFARNRMENRFNLLQEMIVTMARAAALLLGGMKALEHQLTPGDVVLFVSYLDQLYAPVASLTGTFTTLQEHLSSLSRSEKLFRQKVEPGLKLPPYHPGKGEIEFRKVGFGYKTRERVLRGVSFRIKPGEHVALVGPSGAGKTTITDLLTGLFSPTSGHIYIDGQDLNDISHPSLRKYIRGVAADGTVFRMTIADNIRYGNAGATDADVREAADQAGLLSLLDRLPEGFATLVGERGTELSAGERQRVLLARAFLAKPVILVLDEATANLDFKTEASVRAATSKMAQGRTTLTVSHRKSMLEGVDRVLVLHNGVIEQDGTPAELVRAPGWFRDMMLAQKDG